MHYINPLQLKYWRNKRSLSMEELGNLAKVDKSTIYRIEKHPSPKKSIRSHVLGGLARGLNVTEAQLADEKIPAAEAPAREVLGWSRLSFRLNNGSRNAFDLVSRRYRINPQLIADLAPLLFVMVAEDSLRKRAERLSALRSTRQSVGSLPDVFTQEAEHFEKIESRSIRVKDIFGVNQDDPRLQPPQFPKDVTPVGEWNPFALHINEWFEENGESGGIEEWFWNPVYSVCRDVAMAFTGGDADLATALQEGWVGMHEVPPELRGRDSVEERQLWLRERLAAAKAEAEEEEAAREAERKAFWANFSLVADESKA